MPQFFGREGRFAEDPGAFILEPLLQSEPLYSRWPRTKLAELPIGSALAGRSDDELRSAAMLILCLFETPQDPEFIFTGRSFSANNLMADTLAAIGRRKVAWTPEQASRVVQMASRSRLGDTKQIAGFVVSVLERSGSCPDPAAVATYERRLVGLLTPAEAARFVKRLRPFTPDPAGGVDARVANEGDGWGRKVRALLLGLHDSAGLSELLLHLAGSAARPSKKWLSDTTKLLAAAPTAAGVLREMAAGVLEFDLQPGRFATVSPVLFVGANADLARGVMYALALCDPASAPLLGDLAVHTGTTAGGSAVARDERVAVGCITALSLLGTDDAVGALARVQNKVKNRNIRKHIARSLSEAAQRAGMTVDELVERSVPTHGLGPGGYLEERRGEDVLRLAVDGDRVRVLVSKGSGGWTSSIPKRVRDQHGAVLFDLQSMSKEANKTLSAERMRIESLLASDRVWPYPDWERLYRDHPLTGIWAGRLLWEVAEPSGKWRTVRIDGPALVDSAGTTVEVHSGVRIRLWHPMAAPPAEVQLWRSVLAGIGVRQPFKQAWREVYILTPAEERTETYSNRFAAHILRYPQAITLMKGRGWATSALGYWDGGSDGSATKVFPGGRWRARFFYDLVVEHDATPGLCSTDQVHFDELAGDTWQTMPLSSVPPVVFSEAMRDVDLFVGVTSIAADPTWVDGGETRFLDYWYQASFSALSESAATRRAALERLIPRTSIADRVTIDGRFLRVRGQLRTYKIHIGSGNILMEPNDQYLCIVPTYDWRIDRIYLPFEEDGGRLSLIVSKAFLLADDYKITDTTILMQIKGLAT